ncbi:MAG: TolC family protein [Candidatus Acidiferrales bacterium]
MTSKITTKRFFLVLLFAVLACPSACLFAQASPPQAQPPQALTLAQADAIALRNRPRLLASIYAAQAAGQVTREVRSSYFPRIEGNATGAEAENGTRITAGALNNPTVYDRYANGLTVDQLLTDFGRTKNLSESASLNAQARKQDSNATRASVLLQVNEAYYRVLQTQAVLRVAQEAVKERHLVADQIGELAKNQLKSGLDVSFANVNLDQAQLLLTQAQNNVQAAFANLSLALGYTATQSYELVDTPLPPAPAPNLAQFVAQALGERPEVEAGKLQEDSSRAFERAERDLWMPTLSAVGAAGLAPVREAPLLSRYAAAGFNLSIPIFDGGLFTARHAEAHFQAQRTSQNLRETEDQVARDVRVAWLDANTAYQQLTLTQHLQQQAAMALQLAQSRYQLGLSSIVELSQAQLNETQAEIDQASAKYQCQIATADLNFQVGNLH